MKPDKTAIPNEAIVKPEDEHPIEELRPETTESKDEAEYERLKTADFDEDGDDNSDYDPAV